MNRKRECFVIAPIGTPRSKARRRTERLLRFVIRPVAEEKKYNVEIAHELKQPGWITVQVIERIVSSDLVIADLTDNNANVFYELSLRHVLNGPAILLVQENQLKNVPFDLLDMRITEYNVTDPDKIEDAKVDLEKQISAVEDSDAAAKMSNIISNQISVIQEPQGTDNEVMLLGTLLIANRITHELIGQYLRKFRNFERRLEILQGVFANIMRESARKDYLQPNRITSAFPNPEYKKIIEDLFSDIEEIIMSLSDGMAKRNEKEIDDALGKWRRSTLTYRIICAKQYAEVLESEKESLDKQYND